MKADKDNLILENRKARHDYTIFDTFEAGLVLKGTEVKSLRQHKGNLKDSYCFIKNSEIFVIGFHISPYEQGNRFNVDSDRVKKLLLHKKEIIKLSTQTIDGFSIIPLKVYFKFGKIKLLIGLAKGKKNYDKRADKIAKDVERDIRQTLKSSSRKIS